MTEHPSSLPFDGILLIDKAAGFTSFSVIAKLRRLLGIRRIGHIGTLDPFATGLLPVCVGRATGAVSMMEGFDKRYRLAVQLGMSTDSGDTEGVVTGCDTPCAKRIEALTRCDNAALSAAASDLLMIRSQVPPMHSAVKIGGKRLYKLAREGKSVERPARPIRIYESTLVSVGAGDGWPLVTLDIQCSKGTYMREIARSFGALLGLNAYAFALCRTKAGPFLLTEAISLEQLEHSGDDPASRMRFLYENGLFFDIAAAFPTAPKIMLDEKDYRDIVFGRFPDKFRQSLPVAPAPASGPDRIGKTAGTDDDTSLCCFLYNGQTVALAAFDAGSGVWKLKRVFRSHEDLHKSV